MKSKVAIVRCDSYNSDEVYNSLSRALKLLGGIDKFVNKKDRILLKPNILMGTDPAKCVSTHPAVMEAIIKILKENKYKKIYYGDSPSRGNPEKEAEKSGLKQIADKLKIKHADFSSSEKVPPTSVLREIPPCRPSEIPSLPLPLIRLWEMRAI